MKKSMRLFILMGLGLNFVFFRGVAQITNTIALEDKKAAIIDYLKSIHVSFEESLMNGFNAINYKKRFNKKREEFDILFLKNLYDRNNFLKMVEKIDKKTTKIPKIIHQIWLGGKLPKSYEKYQKSWRHFHPDWEYRLWTDSDVEGFNLVNQEAFDQARNFAEKADILRYEIIERYGGVYVDTDFEALRPFDVFNDIYDFYAGMTPITQPAVVCNAFIAAVPHHPILKRCVAEISLNKYGADIVSKTGPIYFSNIIIETCKNDSLVDVDRVIVFPPSYLYPIPPGEGLHKFVRLHSLAIHHWAANWNYSYKD